MKQAKLRRFDRHRKIIFGIDFGFGVAFIDRNNPGADGQTVRNSVERIQDELKARLVCRNGVYLWEPNK
jgi:hypothetical protein